MGVEVIALEMLQEIQGELNANTRGSTALYLHVHYDCESAMLMHIHGRRSLGEEHATRLWKRFLI